MHNVQLQINTMRFTFNHHTGEYIICQKLSKWISNVWDLSSHEESGINEKSLKIFIRYCQLFLEEQILFGIQINKIKKITLELS